MASEKTLSVNGIDLHVTEDGDGPPVLLLHGITVDATYEAYEISQLSQGFRVVAPDLRGHGRSTRPAAFTLQDHVDDAVGLLDALGLETVSVVGVSMGSYVAQALALVVPDRISKLVLVVSKSNGATSSSARLLAEHAEELKDLTPAQQQLWLNAQMFAPTTPPEVLQRANAWFLEQAADGRALTPAQVQAANDALKGFDFREGLPSSGIPALVISGRYDVLNPPYEGEELVSLLPDARLEVFESSGHALTLEEPEHYVASLQAFLG